MGRVKRYDFYGGMNEVFPAHALPDNKAALIQNMYLAKDGVWKNYKVPELLYDTSTVFANASNVYQWYPAYVPSGCVDTYVYVVFKTDKTVIMVWRTATTPSVTWNTPSTLVTLTAYNNVRAVSDSNQFVFVNGRGNDPVYRIRINQSGTIIVGNIAPLRSYQFPTLVTLKYSDDDSGGTGIGKGGIYGYRAVFVNEFEERSAPTPILMIDTYQWQKRGEITADGDYVYSDELSGRLKSATIRISDIPAGAKKIELYRCDAYGSMPLSPMSLTRYVAERVVGNSETTVDIVDSFPYGVMEVQTTGAGNPSGDEVALLSGTIFIANAVDTVDFPVDLTATGAGLWEITITNANEFNYVNCWFMIDLQDEGTNHGDSAYLDSYKWEEYDADKVRIFDDDLITPLDVYYYASDSNVHNNGATTKARRLTFVRIPYVPIGTKKIYFAVSGTAEDYPVSFPKSFKLLDDDTKTAAFLSSLTTSPVKGEYSVIATANKTLTDATPLNSDYRLTNKANSNFEPNYLYLLSTNAVNIRMYADKSFTGFVYQNNADTSFVVNPTATNIVYHNDSIFMKRKGYCCLWLYMGKPASDDTYEIIAIAEYKGGQNQPRISLKVNVNSGAGTYRLFISIDDGDAGVEDAPEYNGTFSSDKAHLFVCFSWDNIINASDVSDSDINTYLHVYDTDAGGFTSDTGSRTNVVIDGKQNFYVYLVENNSTSYVYLSHYTLDYGTVIDDTAYLRHIRQLCRFMPIFPTQSIGIDYSVGNIGGTNYYVNKGITISKITTANENNPGRLFWTDYNAMIGFNEKQYYDEITGLAALKSYMPTDEHSTLLVATKNRVYRTSLVGNSANDCQTIIELDGVGCMSISAMVQITGGVAWVDTKGMYLLLDGVIRNITENEISVTPASAVLVYDPINQWLWLTDSYKAVYQIIEGVWWRNVDALTKPQMFLSYAGTDGYFNFSDKKLYKRGTSTAATVSFKTKAYALRNKLLRHRLVTSVFTGTYSWLVTMYSKYITSGSSSSSGYTGNNNAFTSAPNTKGDYAQLTLSSCDNIIAIDIEDEG